MLKRRIQATEAQLERTAIEALKAILSRVPTIRIDRVEHNPKLTTQFAVDATIEVVELESARVHRIVCEVKNSGQPRSTNLALMQLLRFRQSLSSNVVLILIAPYLSPDSRRLALEQSVGYLDLEGNAHLEFGSVYIDREVSSKPVAESRGLKSLFKPRSACVLRLMLQNPEKHWRVLDLSKNSGVSLGHVSNVRSALLDRQWAKDSEAGMSLARPDSLLDAWRDSYVAPVGEQLRFYTHLHGMGFENAARQALGASGDGKATFASFSASQWLAPYVRTGTHHFYADSEGLQRLMVSLDLTSSAKGENVVITLPRDETILSDTIEPVPGTICTNVVQTYLDLSIAGERGREAAEHLRRERLRWNT